MPKAPDAIITSRNDREIRNNSLCVSQKHKMRTTNESESMRRVEKRVDFFLYLKTI